MKLPNWLIKKGVRFIGFKWVLTKEEAKDEIELCSKLMKKPNKEKDAQYLRKTKKFLERTVENFKPNFFYADDVKKALSSIPAWLHEKGAVHDGWTWPATKKGVKNELELKKAKLKQLEAKYNKLEKTTKKAKAVRSEILYSKRTLKLLEEIIREFKPTLFRAKDVEKAFKEKK